MKQILIVIICFFITSLPIYGQEKYLEEGNEYLNNDEYEKAEKVFRKAIRKEPENMVYQCQLGLSLIEQKKYQEAETVIEKVLAKDSTQIGALWYGGVGNFKAGNDRKAIAYFERVMPLLDKSRGQYYSANWFIGKCYSMLLRTEGLSYQEVDRMLACYEEYLRLQPNAKDSQSIREFVERKKQRRPSKNVEKWIDM